MTQKPYAVITGGNSGLGLATAKRLISASYFVVVAARQLTPELEQLITSNPEAVCFKEFDLEKHTDIHGWVKALVTDFGVPYGLVNNAAVGFDGVLGTMHDTEIIRLMNINVTGTLLLTKYISRSMLRKRTGRIVNVSSIIASTGFNGLSVYAASKAALDGFSKSLARELGKVGITVNTVAPGYMQTAMTDAITTDRLEQITRRSALRRLATVDEAASAIEYLFSESACAITGTKITVDAGSTA